MHIINTSHYSISYTSQPCDEAVVYARDAHLRYLARILGGGVKSPSSLELIIYKVHANLKYD
jgi:hypothetical protein